MAQEALHEVDAEIAQLAFDFGILDEFGDGLLAEQLGDVLDAAHGGVVDRIFIHVFNELSVDLDVIDRQLLEVMERGNASAEIVEREADADLAHLLDELDRAVDIVDRFRFGDLETQLFAVEGGARYPILHKGLEIAVADRFARQIDRNHLGLGHQLAILGQEVDDIADHPFVDARHDAEAFGGGQEFAGIDQLAVAVLEAQQDLAAQPAALELQRFDQLRIEGEMILGHGLVQEMHPG